MKLITLLFLLAGFSAWTQQGSIAHFSIWRPKPGMEQNFETGYKEHLEWHAANRDPWTWYGWYVVSGERTGLFIDATFGHAWSDFDHPVDPAGDAADNALHTVPFGDFLKGYKLALLPDLSTGDSSTLQSKFLRLVTITVSRLEEGKRVLQQLRSKLAKKEGAAEYLVFKVVDGGNLNELHVLIGHNHFSSFARDENLGEELHETEGALKLKTIMSVTVETLLYKRDMSLFPGEGGESRVY